MYSVSQKKGKFMPSRTFSEILIEELQELIEE